MKVVSEDLQGRSKIEARTETPKTAPTPEDIENVFTALYEQAVTEGFVGTFEQFVEIASIHARDTMIQKSQPNRAARRAMKRGF